LRGVLQLETGEARDIVIRKCTEPFWNACISSAEDGGMVAAIGTPGTGKTTSTAILIRLLLKLRHTVVYLVRTEEKVRWYYEFIPAKEANSTRINVKVYPETTKYTQIASLTDPLTYYVVDPGRTKVDCCLDAAFIAKFILVSSPDERHWGRNEFIKERRSNVSGIFKYYPVWSLPELLEARTILSRRTNLSIDDVTQRYRAVGGVPRHLFARKAAYDLVIRRQDLKINSLKVEQLVTEYADATETQGQEHPKSAIMAYRLADDDHEEFTLCTVIVISPLVAEKICTKFMTVNWSIMMDGRMNGPMIFEAYVRVLMTNKASDFVCRPGGPRVRRRVMVSLGGCTEIRLDSHYDTSGMGAQEKALFLESQLVNAARNCAEAKVIFHSTNKSHPLFDFLYKDESDHFHAFQATIGKSHSANVAAIVRLEKCVGNASKLSIYYVVPDFRFAEFQTDPVDPKKDTKANGKASCNIFHVMIANPNV
jgi:hypothetical protein